MDINDYFKNNDLVIGRTICWSKSVYREDNPNSICYFNANIVTLNTGKVWWGDLDITKSGETLKAIADEIGETLYVLREMDARFEDEPLDGLHLITKAVWDTTQEIPYKD